MRNNQHIDRPLLITVLCFPGTVATLDEAAWGLLIRQARNANVLGQMLSAVEAHVSCDQWPLRAQQSFLAEKNVDRLPKNMVVSLRDLYAEFF